MKASQLSSSAVAVAAAVLATALTTTTTILRGGTTSNLAVAVAVAFKFSASSKTQTETRIHPHNLISLLPSTRTPSSSSFSTTATKMAFLSSSTGDSFTPPPLLSTPTPTPTATATPEEVLVSTFTTEEEKRTILPALAKLSADTEMSSYQELQWEYLLKAGDVQALVVLSRPPGVNRPSSHQHPLLSSNNDGTEELLGCVLRIVYGAGAGAGAGGAKNDRAYGMMLVSPKARGQGLAKKLLRAAMDDDDVDVDVDVDVDNENTDDEGDGVAARREILGTCTELGRPMYEKMGFQRVSTVTRMTISLRRTKPLPTTLLLDGCSPTTPTSISIVPSTSPEQWNQILELDRRATGLDRSKTLSALATYPYVSIATCTTTSSTTATTGDNVVKVAALITQYPDSSLATIGPVVGAEDQVLALLQGIVTHYDCSATSRTSTTATSNTEEVALIVSDHPDLVKTLTNAGFQTSFELGAMTMNGVPLPGDRESYMAIIHPTLG